jgi:protein involved in polysaccharide export with SLBB domain
MISRHYILSLIAVGLVMGCGSHPPIAPAPPTLQMAVPGREGYTLQPGDLLSVKFYYNPELNEDLVIRPDGKVSLQLIGDVVAAGQSPAGLATELTKRYASELATPSVTVIVRQFGDERVYVSGEVGKQGIVSLTDGMTLYQAIQAAGGFLDTAHRKQVILVRRSAEGKAVGVAIDVRAIESGNDPDQDVPLQPLDMVFVPKSKIADVNVYVDQYIRKNLPPIPFAFGL